MAALQRADVTDKEQHDLERANDDSAIRIFAFNGDGSPTGVVKSIPAYDLQAQGNIGGRSSSAMKHFGVANIIGSHNDKPHRFDTPGKA